MYERGIPEAEVEIDDFSRAFYDLLQNRVQKVSTKINYEPQGQ